MNSADAYLRQIVQFNAIDIPVDRICQTMLVILLDKLTQTHAVNMKSVYVLYLINCRIDLNVERFRVAVTTRTCFIAIFVAVPSIRIKSTITAVAAVGITK